MNPAMIDTFAILYAPSVNKEKENRLIQKLINIVENLNIGEVNIQINPELPIYEYWENKPNNLITLIIGWGLCANPSWEILIPEMQYLEPVRQFIAIDLFERKRFDGRLLEKPMINAGKYLRQKIKRNNQDLFFDGYFLQANVPYGIRKVQVNYAERENQSSMPLFAFEPGEPSEVEIVRMIFELFVGHDYNRTEICTLLNAQEVEAPKKSGVWNAGAIKTILESPLYIGANQYRGYIKQDVFTPIIEKYIFYEAQAKMSQMDLSVGNTTRKKVV
jgi:hypothetical protein